MGNELRLKTRIGRKRIIVVLECGQGKPKWRRCHATLQGMNRAGMFLDPPSVRVFEQLDRQFGGS